MMYCIQKCEGFTCSLMIPSNSYYGEYASNKKNIPVLILACHAPVYVKQNASDSRTYHSKAKLISKGKQLFFIVKSGNNSNISALYRGLKCTGQSLKRYQI